MDKNFLYRKIPSVDELLKLYKNNNQNNMILQKSINDVIKKLKLQISKKNISANDLDINNIKTLIDEEIIINKRKFITPVINATGTILHTNLGRSLLNEKVAKKIYDISTNYINLEYDIETGKRGRRGDNVIELIKQFTKAEDAIIVNNNAAAVFIILNTFAQNSEVIVSRGEQVEVGGFFRIPDVLRSANSKLIEVGTTNKTYVSDYENAISENTKLLLKVHTSNYKVSGFTNEVSINELSILGKKHNIPVVYDLGSGSYYDLSIFNLSNEPQIIPSLNAGSDIISFSGDKLLGSVQAGIIAGRKEYIDKIRHNQLMRALRVDKITLAALEETLLIYLNNSALSDIPTLNMLTLSEDELKNKVNKLSLLLSSVGIQHELIHTTSSCGGGALPTVNLNAILIGLHSNLLPDRLSELLRKSNVPIITRIYSDTVCLDVRTISENDFNTIKNEILNIWEKYGK